MRLFVAVNFTEEIKCYLMHMISGLKQEAVKGNFTDMEHLHLTLAFLGEIPAKRVPDIIDVIEHVVQNRNGFELKLSGLGKFRTSTESLYWCGVEENIDLYELQKELVFKLKQNGFAVDEKPFQPHITLARRCRMKRGFDEKKFSKKFFEEKENQKAEDRKGADVSLSAQNKMKVTSINLMLSERKNGKLIYSSLGERSLNT